MSKYVWTQDDVKSRPVEGAAVPGAGIIFDLCTEKTVGAETLVVSLAVFRPGYRTEGHGAHPDREHAYYIISGVMHAIIDGVEQTAGPGSVIFFPRGLVHETRNDGPDDLTLLIMRSVVRSGPTPPIPSRER
jgi:quercetin dioxygenase-like cupin family protein